MTQEVSELSLEEFNRLVEESFQIKKTIDEIEKQEIDPLKARLKEIDGIALAQLEKLGVNSFKSKAGLIVRTRKYSVATPKSKEDKEALFQFLKGKGDAVYYNYVGVNSQSINAYYKEEMERAKEEGDFDFSIPGIGEPTVQESITRRKA